MLATECQLLYSVIVVKDHQQLKAEEFFFFKQSCTVFPTSCCTLLISALDLCRTGGKTFTFEQTVLKC